MTDFEYGRLLACKGDRDRAHFHLELVISGKPLEVNAANRKGKYSMEVSLLILSPHLPPPFYVSDILLIPVVCPAERSARSNERSPGGS